MQKFGRDAPNYLDSYFYAVSWASRRNYIIILLTGQMRSNNLTSSMKQSETRSPYSQDMSLFIFNYNSLNYNQLNSQYVSLKAVMSTHYCVKHAISRNPECGNAIVLLLTKGRRQRLREFLTCHQMTQALSDCKYIPLTFLLPSGALVSAKTQATQFKGFCTPFAGGTQTYLRSPGNATQ